MAQPFYFVINFYNQYLEPNGREQGIVQNNHHISMVPALVGHSILKQERFTRGKNHVFPLDGLLPGI